MYQIGLKDTIHKRSIRSSAHPLPRTGKQNVFFELLNYSVISVQFKVTISTHRANTISWTIAKVHKGTHGS